MGLPVKSKKMSLAEQVNIDKRELGQADTLNYNVVTYVVEENYDRAIQELKDFQKRDSEFPNFKFRTERYVAHAIDLINAIRAKRKFPGANSLTIAKQQELNDRFRQHFNELQQVLKNIEKIYSQLKLEDIRSTVYVVKALMNSTIAICLIAFLIEVSHGLFQNFWLVANDFFVGVTDWIFKFI